MRHILIKVLLFAFIGVALMIAAWLFRSPRSLCRNLSCIEIPHRNTYLLKETYADTPDVYRALFISQTNHLRIEARHVVSQEAETSLNASVIRMKALFEKAPAPYPGDISDAVVCDPTFVPTYHEITNKSGTIKYFEGYLNDRMVFGSCSDTESTYRGLMAFIICPSSALTIRAELIAPTAVFTKQQKEFTRQIEALSCR